MSRVGECPRDHADGLGKAATLATDGLRWRLIATPHRFILLGGDPQFFRWWIRGYGDIADGVAFYFMSDDGVVTRLR